MLYSFFGLSSIYLYLKKIDKTYRKTKKYKLFCVA